MHSSRLFEDWAKVAFLAICVVLSQSTIPAFLAEGQTPTGRTASFEIVLPPRVVAGRPATLSTLGADRKLAGHVSVEFGNGERVETDATGRVTFTAPAPGVLLARAGAASAATLVDPVSVASAQAEIITGPFASLHGQFPICGGGFRGDAEGDRVQINKEPGLVLGASPECIVVAPSPKTPPGSASITVEVSGAVRRGSITVVALEFRPPQPPLTPGKKGWLTLRVRGSGQRLRVLVENEAPDVVRFEKADKEEVTTSGGSNNASEIRVEAIRSGDFSFRARVLPQSDPDAARRFLEAAEPLAIADVPRTLKRMEDELGHDPQNSEKIRAELDRMLLVTSPSDFRTLLEAARSVL
jgi:hypothetical protein